LVGGRVAGAAGPQVVDEQGIAGFHRQGRVIDQPGLTAVQSYAKK